MRLHEMHDLISRQVDDVHNLVDLLELTIEDILDRFPDAILDNKHKFGIDEPGDD